MKKARKANLLTSGKPSVSKTSLAKKLFEIAESAQGRGWSAEELLAGEIKKRDRALRKRENEATVKRSDARSLN